MKALNTVPRQGFTSRDRALGITGAWTAFILNEGYAVCSGLGYLSAGSPSDPISDPYLSIMSVLVVLMAPFLLMMMVAVHAYAAPGIKIYSRTALAFMIILVGITSSVNFTLFAVARQSGSGASPWVLPYVTSEWPPLPFALDFFAWDWFFALSMLFAVPVFRGSSLLEKGVRGMMIVSAVLCILGLVWMPVSPGQGTIIGILGWGAAGPIVCLLLARIFTSTQPELVSAPAV